MHYIMGHWTWRWMDPYQVIQFVPFSSPIVGGHVFTPWKGSRFHHPKKGTKNCQLGVVLHFEKLLHHSYSKKLAESLILSSRSRKTPGSSQADPLKKSVSCARSRKKNYLKETKVSFWSKSLYYLNVLDVKPTIEIKVLGIVDEIDNYFKIMVVWTPKK